MKQKPLSLRIQNIISRFLCLQGTPGQIASGLAVGIFIGMSPFIVCHTLLALTIASVFGFNRISAISGIYITNPLTAPFLYQWTYTIGRIFLGIESPPVFSFALSLDFLLSLMQSAPEIILILTVGGIVTGMPLAILGYFFSYQLIRHNRRKMIK